MKTGSAETIPANDATAASAAGARPGLAADYAELVKARLTLLVLVTTAVGYYLAAPSPLNYLDFFQAVFGTALAAAGAAALNQWWERKPDALMERTRTRPVPAGRMSPGQALIAGTAMSLLGVLFLWFFCNRLSAVLAGLTIVIYIAAYTPLKRVSTFNTLVGAIPGALPPLVGWAAARGRIDAGAWSLFAIMMLWQLPHFFAIAWMCRKDYSRAGFQMISNDDETGERSASQSVFFSMLLLVVAGIPGFVGVASQIYVPIEVILSALYVASAMNFLKKKNHAAARSLFLASIIYLPLLFGALVLTKI